MTNGIRPTTLPEAVRVAVHHLRCSVRLRPRYGAADDAGRHVDSALALLVNALREEEVTQEIAVPNERPGP